MKMKKKQTVEDVALALFRTVHGDGDSGSPHAFHCQNPCLIEGWLKLARRHLAMRRKVRQLDKAFNDNVRWYEDFIEKKCKIL
jgi:hypothetical protein